MAVNQDVFLKSNKKTTVYYRGMYAKAIGTTGTIPKITQMAFGDHGDKDTTGNPTPPTGEGTLNHVVLTKNITKVSYPVDTTVEFEAEIKEGEWTGDINEVALIDEQGQTVAKMRLLTPKGIDGETSAIFRWQLEF